MAYCGKCGTNAGNAAFCGSCGTSVGGGSQGGYQPQAQSNSQTGMGCFHHPSQQAVIICQGDDCGKGMCRDCYDSYGAGMGAGKALCFDCTEELVIETASEIAWLREQVKKERMWMYVGAGLGAIIIGPMLASGGELGFIGWLFGVAIGMSLGTIVNGFREFGWLVGVIMIIVSPIMSIVRFKRRFDQIKQCDEILESDARVLQEMRDYFAYTQAMERNAGVSLESLVNQGGELFQNSYAQSVMQKGEQGAQAALREGAVQIAANGEIVRTFDKRIEQRREAA